jgi:hypothetical protein
MWRGRSPWPRTILHLLFLSASMILLARSVGRGRMASCLVCTTHSHQLTPTSSVNTHSSPRRAMPCTAPTRLQNLVEMARSTLRACRRSSSTRCVNSSNRCVSQPLLLLASQLTQTTELFPGSVFAQPTTHTLTLTLTHAHAHTRKGHGDQHLPPLAYEYPRQYLRSFSSCVVYTVLARGVAMQTATNALSNQPLAQSLALSLSLSLSLVCSSARSLLCRKSATSRAACSSSRQLRKSTLRPQAL